MITTTVGGLLRGELDQVDTMRHHIYVVRDGDVTFYVGRSMDPEMRLLDHCGLGPLSALPSPLGALILDNAPESGAWQVELRTVPDCEPTIREQFPYYRVIDWWHVGTAECALIRALRPCLNRSLNPDPTPLPARYDRTDETALRKAAELIHVPYMGR